jgi:L-fuconolactonase
VPPLIDAHQHFWRYVTGEFPWINESMGHLRRDFLPTDLQPEMAVVNIEKCIAVQARQSVEETEFLIQLAGTYQFIAAVVGWVPLVDPDITTVLERVQSPKLKGVRHVLQDEPDDNYILRSDFNRGIAALHPFNLVYDILIFERHLPRAIQFVDRHPNQIFVLDHLAKPRVRAAELSPWRENLKTLAERPNVYCKLSGLVTEADWKSWTDATLEPYLDTALEAFTPSRLMFGSDWPVLLAAGTYSGWFRVVRNLTATLSADEQALLWGGNAVRVYGIA